MSTRIRGQEVTVGLIVDGAQQLGSFTKVEQFKLTPRTDLSDADFLGEKESEPDIQHHGFDFSFMTHEQDSKMFDLLFDIVNRERLGAPHPVVDVIVIHKYRDPGLPSKNIVLQQCVVKLDDHDIGGRKEFVKDSFSGKCRRIAAV